MKTYLIVSGILGFLLFGSSLLSDGSDRKKQAFEPIHHANEHWLAHAHTFDSGNRLFWFW